MWNMSQESCFWFMLNCTLNTEQCSCPLFILFSGCTYFTFTHTENIHTHSPHFQRIWPLLLAHTPEKHPHFDLKLRVHLFLVTDPGFCPSNSFCICCGNESLFLLWSLLIYRIISFKRKKIWNGKWWPRVLELKSSCFCWSCPSGTSPVSQKASFLFGKKQENGGCAVRHIFDNGSFMMRCRLWTFGHLFAWALWVCYPGKPHLKNDFAELHFSAHVFFFLTFCRNPSGRFIWDVLYVALRLAGRLFIDSFTPTNHSCHPRNALYSSLPLGSAIFDSSVTEAAVY